MTVIFQGRIAHTLFGLTLVATLFASTAAHAQRRASREPSYSTTKGIELSGFYGWQYGGDFTTYMGEIEIRDNENFGGSIGFPVPSRPEAMLELSYTRQNTTVDLKSYPSGAKEELFDAAVEYYQLGAMYNRRVGSVSPFGGFSLGAARFAPKQNSIEGIQLEDEWRFALTLGLGVKSYFNERLGLRLQGRLLMPMNFYGTSFWFGTGGASAGVSGGSAILQGDVSGGLFFLF
ncbi:MAG: hypothetical protein ACREOO_25835 [bacterium]